MESSILIPLHDRIKYQLPKSLAGRIPKLSLLWAYEYWMMKQLQRQAKEKQQKQTDIGVKIHRAINDRNTDVNDHNYKELVHVATILSNLVLLDRFRPMLLPRHLTDVYAALFQAEHLMSLSSLSHTKQLPSIMSEKGTKSLYHKLGLLPATSTITSADETTNLVGVVDATLQAKAYQTLLLQGTRSPKWLRQRVSALLTSLATHNLAAILNVFVPASSTISSTKNDDTTNAAHLSSHCKRLGQTLVVSTTDDRTRQQICHQIMELLVHAYPIGGTLQVIDIPPRSMAVIQTAWAMIDHLPQHTIETNLIQVWSQNLINRKEGLGSETVIHATIRQIGALCADVPPHYLSNSSIRYVLDKLTSPSILGPLLRLTCSPSLKVVFSPARLDAERVLQWLTIAAYMTDDPTKREKVISGWIDSIASYSIIDTKEFQYAKVIGNHIHDGSDSVGLDSLHAQEASNGLSDFSTMISDMNDRVDFFINTIVLVLAPPSNLTDMQTIKDKESTNHLEELPSGIFRFVLRAYLTQKNPSVNESTKYASRQLVAMILLPKLCERCSQEQLLFGDRRGALGLLLLIREVLSEALSTNIGKFVREFDSEFFQSEETRKETLLSIASIVMNMLIAVLELGSKQRSSDEEEMFHSFLPILQEMSDPTSDVHGLAESDRAALADMASYAMTMIASRKITKESEPEQESNSSTVETKLRKILKEAEIDLRSTQIPLRARGMVSLGRLARGFAGAIERERAPSIIEELEENRIPLDHDQKAFLINEIVRLSTVALSDKESYVYLAAIQAIVAVGDFHPAQVLPLITSGVVSGKLVLSKSQGSTGIHLELSQEQRIKMAEALMFIIRRRAVTDSYVPTLVQAMLYSNSQQDRIGNSQGDSDSTDHELIEQETRRYFTGEDDAGTNLKEKLEERSIRAKTGGPVFDSEEADAVRSVRISILAELLCASSPSAMAPYCKTFVPLVVDALKLDRSRLITRAAALLARELYNCSFREAEGLVEWMADGSVNRSFSDTQTIPFSVALVSSSEGRMLHALREYAEGRSAEPVIDAATSVRCEEAIGLRTEAEEAGIFLAAGLVINDVESLDKFPDILKISRDRRPRTMKLVDPEESLE
jgi:hypothetical protein